MLKRIALVAWWLGAISGIAAGVVMLGETAEASPIGPVSGALMIPMMVAICSLPWWALSYVLGGSFWRPPKP